MNLYDLIQQIPEFIRDTLLKSQNVPQKKAKGSEEKHMVGRFHMGLNYDMLIWLQNSQCRVFPCQQEQEVTVRIKDKASGQLKKQVRKNMVDIYLVITETVLLMLKTDTNIKNVAKLLAWASLPALEKIKHSLEANDQITLQFRPAAEGRKPWVVNVLMNQNSNECISLIVKHLKRDGVKVKKDFEKKRKILESEVKGNAMKTLNIDSLLATIKEYEAKLEQDLSSKTAQHLIALYNKAVEYYSALNDDRHLEYLMKLQSLFTNEKL